MDRRLPETISNRAVIAGTYSLAVVQGSQRVRSSAQIAVE